MTSYSKEQLETFKKLLKDCAYQIDETLKNEQEASNIVTLDQSRIGRLSRMDAMQQQEMAKAELQQTKKRLKLVKLALSKFKNDEYGWCEDCDEMIANERLMIKPESQYCINCQSKREQA